MVARIERHHRALTVDRNRDGDGSPLVLGAKPVDVVGGQHARDLPAREIAASRAQQRGAQAEPAEAEADVGDAAGRYVQPVTRELQTRLGQARQAGQDEIEERPAEADDVEAHLSDSASTGCSDR